MDFNEKAKNARAFVVLLAALICWLLNMKYKRDLLESLIILVIVIAVFYVISTAAIWLIRKIRDMEDKRVDIEDAPVENDEHDNEGAADE